MYVLFTQNSSIMIPAHGLYVNVIVRFINLQNQQSELIAYVLPTITLTLQELEFVQNNIYTLHRPRDFDEMVI